MKTKNINSLLSMSLVAVVLIVFSTCCNRISPEEQVRNYAQYFVEKLNANQLDSLVASYPDIEIADSVINLKCDSVIIEKIGDEGVYEVILNEGVRLKLNYLDKGEIKVMETRGVFAYPEAKMTIAKKTGLWNDTINDVNLNKRMNDEAFFKYVKDIKKINPKTLITIGKFTSSDKHMGLAARDGSKPLINNTDVEIKGTDYYIIYYCRSGVS